LGTDPVHPTLKKVLELSLREALSVEAEIDTEHLLLGLVQENEGVAAEILNNAGLDRQTFRDEVERTPKLTGPSPQWVELSDEVRAALSEAITAVAKATRVALDAEDGRRAGVIAEAERLLTRMLN
jgi:ATP-dependent Clp protease ATP-binding subunit ClpA